MYKFLESNDRSDKMQMQVNDELHDKDGSDWKLVFVVPRTVNTIFIFEQISGSNLKPNILKEVTITSEKPTKKAPITID